MSKDIAVRVTPDVTPARVLEQLAALEEVIEDLASAEQAWAAAGHVDALAYALKRAKAGHALESRAAKLRLRAERRLGELLQHGKDGVLTDEQINSSAVKRGWRLAEMRMETLIAYFAAVDQQALLPTFSGLARFAIAHNDPSEVARHSKRVREMQKRLHRNYRKLGQRSPNVHVEEGLALVRQALAHIDRASGYADGKTATTLRAAMDDLYAAADRLNDAQYGAFR